MKKTIWTAILIIILAQVLLLLFGCYGYKNTCPGPWSGRHEMKLVAIIEQRGDSLAIFHCFRTDVAGNRVCGFRDTIVTFKKRM